MNYTSSVLLGAAAAPLVVLATVPILGFGAGGVIAGTPAAWLMSTYGGVIGAGSICASFQSIGAAGLTYSGIVTTGVAGGVAGSAAESGIKMVRNFFSRQIISEEQP